MFGIAIVSKGLGNACKDNILHLLEKHSKNTHYTSSNVNIRDEVVLFDVEDIESICALAYKCQAASRILLLLEEIDITGATSADIEEYLNNSVLNKKGFDALIENIVSSVAKDGVVRFRGSTNDNILDVAPALGGVIIDAGLKMKQQVTMKVDLDTPEMIFYGFVNHETARKRTKLYIGLDFSLDISKRDYKIFNSPMSLKGPTAFGLLSIAKYDPDEFTLDPFCNSGTLGIEAALYSSGLSSRYYNKDFPFVRWKIIDTEKFFKNQDSKSMVQDTQEYKGKFICADPLLRNITASKKNAKVANVEKLLEFRRIDVDWIDGKFDVKGVDKVITFIPGSSKNRPVKDLEKEYKQLFYNLEYVLKDKGVVVILCITKDLLISSSEEYFKLEEKIDLYSGELKMTALIFSKIKKVKK